MIVVHLTFTYDHRYFEGKRSAERALLAAFPAAGAGVVLRPGFMYGTRMVPISQFQLPLPLGLFGKPLQLLVDNTIGKQLRSHLPGMLAPLAPPLPVRSVAQVAVAAAMGEKAVQVICQCPQSGVVNILSVADIQHVCRILAGRKDSTDENCSFL